MGGRLIKVKDFREKPMPIWVPGLCLCSPVVELSILALERNPVLSSDTPIPSCSEMRLVAGLFCSLGASSSLRSSHSDGTREDLFNCLHNGSGSLTETLKNRNTKGAQESDSERYRVSI